MEFPGNDSKILSLHFHLNRVYAVHYNVYSVYMAKSTAHRIAEEARLLLDQEGPEAVTMRRVAQAAGITAMAVYRHFPDRAGLLNALADAGFGELTARLSGIQKSKNIEKRLNTILDLYLEYALKNPRLFELMFMTRRAGARQYPVDFKTRQSPTANVAAEAIEDGMASGHFRKDNAWEITFEMGALLQGMVMLYLGGRVAMEPEEFRAFCNRSFRRYFRGIRR
jgi:AcrR family transcriptional regulator